MLCIVSPRPVEETMLDIVIVILVVATAAWIALRLVRNQQHAAGHAASQAEVDAMVASASMAQKAAINAAFNKKLGSTGAAVGFLVLQQLKNKGK